MEPHPRSPPDGQTLVTVNDVPLFATNEYAVPYTYPQHRIEWGTWHEHGEYRRFGEAHADLDRLATIGLYFELLWGVSTHWLWKYTNDTVLSARTLEDVAALDYSDDYDFDMETRVEIATAIWEFIEDTPAVQDRLIANRTERLSDSTLTSEIHRLSVERYTGEYELDDILFTDANREQFHDFVEEHEWDVDPDAYIDEKFDRVETHGDDQYAVVTTDATPKPVVRFLDGLVALDPTYSRKLAKVVEIAPFREDVELDATFDYDTGAIEFSLTTA